MTLRVRTTTVFHGPNIWSSTPVLCVDLGSEPMGAEVTGGVRDALLEMLRRIEPERDTDLTIDPRTAPESANPGEWAGWLSVVLQRLCEVPVERSFHRSSQFAFEFLHERVGKVAAYLALRFLNHHIAGSEPAFDLERELARLGSLNRAYDHGPTGRAFAAAARRRGIPLRTVDPRGRIVELGNGRYRQRILGTMTSCTAALGDIISSDKLLANRFLAEAGFPVPAAAPARDVEQASERAARIGYPVVLKPLDQADSYLVFVDIRDEAELRARFETITRELGSPVRRLLLERFVRGNVYRALVVGDWVVGVFQRVPAHVFGDGTSSVEQLVERENAEPRRQGAELLPIQIEDESLLVLARQGLTPDSVPAPGRRVELKPQIGHRRDGGLARECTDELHPDNARLLIHATRAIGLDVAGIDFVTSDCARPIILDGGAIIEVNSAPDFERHLRPSVGVPRDGAAALIDLLFPPGQRVQASIVAVSGGSEAAEVVASISGMLATAGATVGMVADRRLTVAGLVLGTMPSNHRAATMALNHPSTEIAVVETPTAEIVEQGLAFDVCDVAVVTSLASATPAGLAQAESVVCRQVAPGGMLVVPADDREAVELARSFDRPIVLYAAASDSRAIQRHRRDDDRTVSARAGAGGTVLVEIGWEAGAAETLTLAGDAKPSVVAASVGAVLALGISVDALRQSMSGSRSRVKLS
jgi:cyanophycin synthetase